MERLRYLVDKGSFRSGALMAKLERKAHAFEEEFKQLLALFENGLVGLLTMLRPTPFTQLGPDEQDARLAHWQRSSVALFNTGYQALVRLAHATYFSSPEIYSLIGYPGPPTVPGEADPL